jgi:hypothetical protein
MNKHLVLLRYINLMDVAEKEGYKIRPDLAELFVGMNSAEEMVYKFAGVERYKCACELMAYIAHRRAAVWWGYRCVLSLLEELRINPAEERDIADIGANLEVEVPDFAKVEPPKTDPEFLIKMQKDLDDLQRGVQEARTAVHPEMLKLVEDALGVFYDEFTKFHGIHPLKLMEKLADKIAQDPYAIDPNSPIFQEAAKLKAQLAAVQKETVDTIKSVIPPKVPAHQKKLRDNALTAVYRWVAAPDGENAQKCLDVGNECPDTPAGLLSLAAFWAFGDLLPLGEQTVPTPPGLAANGLCQVLLLAALHQGGTRKLKERYEEYFRLGVEVLTGADNWEASLASKIMPHEELPAVSRSAPPQPPPPEAPASPASPGSNAGDVRTGSAPVPPPPADSGTRSSPQTPPPGGAPPYKRWKPGEEN